MQTGSNPVLSVASERMFVLTKPASQSHYSSLSISLHWVMLILLVAVYACMELRGYYPKGSDFREGLKMWHFMFGLMVLLLVLIRIVARVTGGFLCILRKYREPIKTDEPCSTFRAGVFGTSRDRV